MGKVKSAIITALVVAVIVILSLFATISCDVPGSDGVDRYNSFLSNVHMGREFTGDVYALFYPEGVLSAADYNLAASGEDKEEYEKKYAFCDGVYVKNEKIETPEDEKAFRDSIANDAKVISDRLDKKGYSSYTVSVEADCAYVIKVAVPSNFNYAEYKSNDIASREAKLNQIGSTLTYLVTDGALRFCDSSDSSSAHRVPMPCKGDYASYFTGAGYRAMGGNHYVWLELTEEGFSDVNVELLTGSSDGSIYIYVGETNIGLTISRGSALEDRTLYFQVDEAYAHDFSVLLDSAIHGNVVENDYNDSALGTGTVLVALTPSFGEHAAIYLLVAILLVLVGAVVYSCVRYKKLGFVNALSAFMYALIILLAIILTGVQLTVAGAFTAVLGFALLMFSNFYAFEAVRKETLSGRTLQAAVKTGYKKTRMSVLDMHIVSLVVAGILALICSGELAACGLIFFIATAFSYVLHWFTRFMWYVVSSPARDKFKFCGFKREVLDDED